MKTIPQLEIFHKMHPGALVLMDGHQLLWGDNYNTNSITFFEDESLKMAKDMARGMNDVEFHGNLRFSCTVN